MAGPRRFSLITRDMLNRVRALDRQEQQVAVLAEEEPEPVKAVPRCAGWVPHPTRPIKVGCDSPTVGQIMWLDEQVGYCWTHAEEIIVAATRTRCTAVRQ